MLRTTNELESFFYLFFPALCHHVRGIQVELSCVTTAWLIVLAYGGGQKQTCIQQTLKTLSHNVLLKPRKGG